MRVQQEIGPALLPPTSTNGSRWELSANDLIGRDNALALAKLRIDLEQALDRICQTVKPQNKASTEKRIVSIMQMTRSLIEAGVLPDEILAPMQQVAAACNMAVHGGVVSDETAAAIVAAGSRLLELLEAIRAAYGTSIDE